MAEAAGDHHAVQPLQQRHLASLQIAGVDPLDLGRMIVEEGRVPDGLGDAEVGIGHAHVLADDADAQGRLGPLDLLHQRAPGVHAGGHGRQAQLAHQQVAEATILQHQRHLIDGLGGEQRDHRLLGDVAEEGDLLAQLLGHGVVGAADDHIRLDTDAAQLLDAVLDGLGLQLAGGADVGEQGHVM